MNKLAEFPLERAGLSDAPDDTVIVAWPGWSLTVGDIRTAALRGSATGIDLEWSKLREVYAKAGGADEGKRALMEYGIALARVTPQHPDLERYLEWYKNAQTREEARNAKACIESLSRDTPQHSVTEQATARLRAVEYDSCLGSNLHFGDASKVYADLIAAAPDTVTTAADQQGDWLKDELRMTNERIAAQQGDVNKGQ